LGRVADAEIAARLTSKGIGLADFWSPAISGLDGNSFTFPQTGETIPNTYKLNLGQLLDAHVGKVGIDFPLVIHTTRTGLLFGEPGGMKVHFDGWTQQGSATGTALGICGGTEGAGLEPEFQPDRRHANRRDFLGRTGAIRV